MSYSRGRGFKKGGRRGRGRGRGKSVIRTSNGTGSTNGLGSLTIQDDDSPPMSLDEREESLVTKFMNITHSTEVVAEDYLAMSQNNLNEAIATYWQSLSPVSSAPPTSLSTTHTPATQQPADESGFAPPLLSPVTYENTYGVRPPIPRIKERLIEEPREANRSKTNSNKRKLPNSVFSDDYTTTNASKKSKKLHELYKDPVDITFKGTFDQAKNQAKLSQKWLLVNIQDKSVFNSHIVNRDIWRSSRIRNLLTNHFTFWQVPRDSPDANWYSRFYQVTLLPYIAILDSTTGKLLKEIQTVDHDVFIELVEEFLRNFEVTSNHDTQAASSMSYEDDEFKAAIAASLMHSQNGTTTGGVSQATDGPTSSRQPECEYTEDGFEPSMPWVESDSTIPLIPGDAVTRILIRCLDGSRRSATFSQTQPIKAMFDYLTMHGMDTSELEILCTHPRILLNDMDPLTSFKEAALAPSATIFIQYP